MQDNDYTESSISVFEGLEGVRKRPSMYIGDLTNGVFQCLKEVVDNALDEASSGYSKVVRCIRDQDRFYVCDEGRGIPTGIHPKFEKEKISTLQVILTKLHAGGKLEAGAYARGSIGCFTGDTRVKLPNGSCPTFEQLWDRWEHDHQEFPVFSKPVDCCETGFQVNNCYGVYRTKQVTTLAVVTLDNGEVIKCTVDHPFMNCDHSYTQAKDLKVGQRLASLYWTYDSDDCEVYTCYENCDQRYDALTHHVAHVHLVECQPTWVYGMSVENDHNYLLNAGVFVKNTHGVGVSCTNALSKDFQAWTYRDRWYTQTYSEGKPTSPVQTIPSKSVPFNQKKGTIVSFTPDSSILPNKIDNHAIIEYLETCSFLNSNIEFSFEDRSRHVVKVFKSKGLVDYVAKLTTTVDQSGHRVDKFETLGKPFVFKSDQLDIVLQWFESDNCVLTSWVNSSKTIEGGTHLTGLHKAITNAFAAVSKKKAYKPEDLRVGLYGGINLIVPEPQFDSQTKEKLINPEAEKIVLNAVQHQFEMFLSKNKSFTKRVLARASEMRSIYNKFLSEKKALSKIKTKGKNALPPPSKFIVSNCKDDNLRELYITEGESAGGTAKAARDPHYQEVLKLKGKILNTAKAPLTRVYESEDILNILKAVGFDPINKNHNLRVGKVIILTDADVDGSHISVLLLTLFKLYYPELLSEGRVYCVDAPLFIGKTRTRTLYGGDLRDVQQQAGNEKLVSVTRLKGWGECNADLLKTMAFDPKTRNLIQITDVNEEDLKMFKKLVGEDTELRKSLLNRC